MAALLVIGVGAGGCKRSPQESVAPAKTQERRLSAGQTEESWLVGQVSSYIRDLGEFGRKTEIEFENRGRVLTSTGVGYEFGVGGRIHVVSMETGLWTPVSYAALAKELAGEAEMVAPELSDTEFARVLLSPGLGVLLEQNKRLSDFLSEHPASSAGHVQAALLLGVIALNDYSGTFRDVRIPLNRMVAHLAIADALGIASDSDGRRLAELLRLTLCGLQSEALLQLRDFHPKGDGALGEWAVILRLRNTCDWRMNREKALAGSDALKQEYFRALVRSVGAGAGLQFLKDAGVSSGVGYTRIANETRLSVAQGHAFTRAGLSMELAESAAAAKAFGIDAESKGLSWFKTYAGTPEGSPVTEGSRVEVAGRNLWAGYHQRNVMQATHRLFVFLNDNWGVREEAGKLDAFVRNTLPETRYTPFLKRLMARTDAARRAANTQCEPVIRERPELVMPALWVSLRENEDGRNVLSCPDHHAWFNPEVLPGTAFEVDERLYQIGVGDENDNAWMKEVWSRAPYGYIVARYNAYHENGDSYDNMPPAVAEKWLGTLTGFNAKAARLLARSHRGDPEKYQIAMEKAAQLDPDLYLEMAEFLESRGLHDKAGAAYLVAFEKAEDRVHMANESLPLVKFLYQKGDMVTAEKVAAAAAEVYSYRGLEAHMWLLEQKGDWKAALTTARKIDDRYNEEPISLAACLARYSVKDPVAAKAGGHDKVIARFFPAGMKRVDVADFSGAPKKGVRINGDSKLMRPFGLSEGMVIVALDGVQTDNFKQYQVVRELSSEPAMSLIVWDGTGYRKSEGLLPGRRFQIDMGDYAR